MAATLFCGLVLARAADSEPIRIGFGLPVRMRAA
jgi:hypothetical protein